MKQTVFYGMGMRKEQVEVAFQIEYEPILLNSYKEMLTEVHNKNTEALQTFTILSES